MAVYLRCSFSHGGIQCLPIVRQGFEIVNVRVCAYHDTGTAARLTCGGRASADDWPPLYTGFFLLLSGVCSYFSAMQVMSLWRPHLGRRQRRVLAPVRGASTIIYAGAVSDVGLRGRSAAAGRRAFGRIGGMIAPMLSRFANVNSDEWNLYDVRGGLCTDSDGDFSRFRASSRRLRNWSICLI